MSKPEDVRDMLLFARKHNIESCFMWDDDLKFFIICNDVFYWGCADAEEITVDDFEMFIQCEEDLKATGEDRAIWDAPILFCCRKRGMRPQIPMLEHFTPKVLELIKACGPEREDG